MAHDEAYREAEKKIEVALRSGATKLDLSIEYNLFEEPHSIELPESLGQLAQLQSLDLTNMRLATLPESLSQLTQLQTLNLSNNQVTALPKSLGQLTQLQTLDLSGNRLTALPESLGGLAALTQLQTLDLSGNQLTVLPESLGHLTQLKRLSLRFNRLTTLPRWLGKFTQLRSLDLRDCQLTSLPKSLGQLAQLQSLNISNNELMAIPESIVNLTQLQELEIYGNKLRNLPALAKLKELTVLNLYGNPLKTLPDWLGELDQLITLQIGNLGISKLPEVVQKLTNLKVLRIHNNNLSMLPSWIGNLVGLEFLDVAGNLITELPESLGNLTKLKDLTLGQFDRGNLIHELPSFVRELHQLTSLLANGCMLVSLPDWLGDLTDLQRITFSHNSLTDLPHSLARLDNLETLDLDDNPLNPELAEAYKQGHDAVKAYLRAKAEAQITLNEAKLILVGEGEVGKTCLMDALVGNPWLEHDTTHGIEIKSIQAIDPDSAQAITLNGWDFGGQCIYRPTHQLFFSAPAVYLVVWKPREGLQQGLVKDWIKLIKHREPTAKILVVATHGGPQQRQPDIDRQELWDLFGKDTVIDFFHVESKPDTDGARRGIEELKQAIARVAVTLPEVGRSVPKRWQEVREKLEHNGAAYLPYDQVLALCRKHQMDDEQARLFIAIEHRLGHLIHYEHDPALRDIVVLKPDWLATAISFVLDDADTRVAHGLVRFSRLQQLWADPVRAEEFRYPSDLHPIFLRLMERFDLSYRVADPFAKDDANPQSLIAQLVPDNKPDPIAGWVDYPGDGNVEQMQICRIVDAKGQSATAEGLFYQLIVRLHRYSLGRANYAASAHWQRGLVLDDDYNGRALLEYKGNDVHITVRAPYPERFLTMLTEEVKYLVESFWEGLCCDVMVPCLNLKPCLGLFEVPKLIENKRRGRPEQPCPVCNEWQSIDALLLNAPAARPVVTSELFANRAVLSELNNLRSLLISQHDETFGRFDRLDAGQKELLSKADAAYTSLLRVLTDEAKEGPRLFSFVPVDRSNFKPREWASAEFRLTLWCEHSRLPLPAINGKDSTDGVYEIEMTRTWFKKAAPLLKFVTGTLSLVLPVASSGLRLALDDTAYKAIEEQLSFDKDIIDASLDVSDKSLDWLGGKDSLALEHGEAVHAQGVMLREFHALLKAKDPASKFGGLVRVLNKRQEFLWVHPMYEKEY